MQLCTDHLQPSSVYDSCPALGVAVVDSPDCVALVAQELWLGLPSSCACCVPRPRHGRSCL